MHQKWIKTVRKTYKVYLAKNNDILAEGTAEECAEQMDIQLTSFRAIVHHAQTGARKKYRVDVFEPEVIPELAEQAEKQKPKPAPNPPKPQVEKPEKFRKGDELARNWDKVCEPLRKKYGIKVKHHDA